MACITFITVLIILGHVCGTTESRSTFKETEAETKQRRSAGCTVGNEDYRDGDSVVFHNTTFPILDASCTHCYCSDGNVENCFFSHCDVGLGNVPVELCEQWLTGQKGVCCPICECIHNGQKKKVNEEWVKRTSSPDACYQCSCSGQGVQCQQYWCMPCDGTSVSVPRKCCPECRPAETTTPPSFTIELTTTGAGPTFPPFFPFGKKKKRDVE